MSDHDYAEARCRCGRPCAPGREVCSLDCDGTRERVRGYTLLSFGKAQAPTCQGWHSFWSLKRGVKQPCPTQHIGSDPCPLCARLTEQARRKHRELDDKAVQRRTYGPARDDEDVFAGLRGEE